MKWYAEYRAGVIEDVLVSIWCRCGLFVGAILLGNAFAATVRNRGVPSWGEVWGPIPISLALWFYFPRFLLTFAVTIIGLARILQTEASRELCGWLISVAVA